MRNDKGNKPRKKLAGGKRVGRQFGGGLSRPLTSPLGGAGVGAPIRPVGFKHGKRAKKK